MLRKDGLTIDIHRLSVVPKDCVNLLMKPFEHAHSLFDGNDGMASKYGAIHYYEDEV